MTVAFVMTVVFAITRTSVKRFEDRDRGDPNKQKTPSCNKLKMFFDCSVVITIAETRLLKFVCPLGVDEGVR